MLSKSAFLLGHRCKKSLWLKQCGKSLGISPRALDATEQFRVDQGQQVGQLAQQRFPDGVHIIEIAGLDITKRAKETTRLLKDGASVLFEPVFVADGCMCAVDILVRDGHGWHLYEVKASTSIKEEHLLDVAFQYHVLTGCGLDIDDVYITHVNNGYVREGELDLDQLFVDGPVTDQVLDLQEDIEAGIARLQGVMDSADMPCVDIGTYCKKPHDCRYRHHCWRNIPEGTVLDLTRGGEKAWGFYRSGIVKLKDIPATQKLSATQRIQVEAEKTGSSIIDRDSIHEFLDGLRLPLCFLDFETTSEAVPSHDGLRPYQQLPFQWSLHVLTPKEANLTHEEFLARADEDPRQAFIVSLLSVLPERGSVIVYNRSFEDRRLSELQEHFPSLDEEIQAIRDRLVDLMIPFQKRWYYTLEMRGRYSIKAVLPALVPDLSYSDLAIGDGGSASAAFVALRDETDPEHVRQVRQQLLSYCEMDTWAMVQLLERLYTV